MVAALLAVACTTSEPVPRVTGACEGARCPDTMPGDGGGREDVPDVVADAPSTDVRADATVDDPPAEPEDTRADPDSADVPDVVDDVPGDAPDSADAIADDASDPIDADASDAADAGELDAAPPPIPRLGGLHVRCRDDADCAEPGVSCLRTLRRSDGTTVALSTLRPDVADGEGICAGGCLDAAADCARLGAGGWSCHLVDVDTTEDGTRVAQVCRPPEPDPHSRQCAPCTEDAGCGVGEVCYRWADRDHGAETGDGSGAEGSGAGGDTPPVPGVCVRPCALAEDCGLGFRCDELFGSSGASRGTLCLPVADTCGTCRDTDGDGYGDGTGCTGPDCDDRLSLVNPGATEVCGPLDRDCDGRTGHETFLGTAVDCGACGQPCASGVREAAVCVATSGAQPVCERTCERGYADCDGLPGCETFVQGDRDNCGACGARCPSDWARGNARWTCDRGECVPIACFALGEWRTGDCNGDPSDGCETALNTRDNCGGCGVDCPDQAGQSGICSAGIRETVCRLSSCAPGTGDCLASQPGCETDLTTSLSHCGGCGNACADLPLCRNADCRCDGGQCRCVPAAANQCNGRDSTCDGVADVGCPERLERTGELRYRENDRVPEQLPERDTALMCRGDQVIRRIEVWGNDDHGVVHLEIVCDEVVATPLPPASPGSPVPGYRAAWAERPEIVRTSPQDLGAPLSIASVRQVSLACPPSAGGLRVPTHLLVKAVENDRDGATVRRVRMYCSEVRIEPNTTTTSLVDHLLRFDASAPTTVVADFRGGSDADARFIPSRPSEQGTAPWSALWLGYRPGAYAGVASSARVLGLNLYHSPLRIVHRSAR